MIRGGDAGAGTAVDIDDQVTDSAALLASRAAVYKVGDCTVPTGVCSAPNGSVFVSELRANSVSRLDWVGLTVNPTTGWAKTPKVVVGTSRPAGLDTVEILGRVLLVGAAMRGNDVFWSDVTDPAVTNANAHFLGLTLSRPMGVCAVTSSETTVDLYVTDTRGDAVRTLQLTYGTDQTGGLVLLSQTAASEVQAFAGLLDRPYDVTHRTVDGGASSELFVASAHNHKVLRGGLGASDVATEIDFAPLPVEFPTGIDTDGSVLYVVDHDHHRVTGYDLEAGTPQLISGTFPRGPNLLQDQDYDKLTRESYNRPFDCAVVSGGSSLVLTSGADNAVVTVVVSLNPPKVQSLVVEDGGDHGAVRVCFTYKDHPRVAADTATPTTFSVQLSINGSIQGSLDGQTSDQDAAGGFAGTYTVPLGAQLSSTQVLQAVVSVHKGEHAASSAPFQMIGAASPTSTDQRFVTYEPSDGYGGAPAPVLEFAEAVETDLPAGATMNFADLSWMEEATYRMRAHGATVRSCAVPSSYKWLSAGGGRTLVGPYVDLQDADLEDVTDWTGVSAVQVRGIPAKLPAGFADDFVWESHAGGASRTLFGTKTGNGLAYEMADFTSLDSGLRADVHIEGSVRRAKTAGLTLAAVGTTPSVATNAKWWVNGDGLATLLAPGADLRNADLTGADMGSADLTDALLDNADLSGASAASAKFTGASMRRTKMAGAALTNASFPDDASSVLMAGNEQAPAGKSWLRKLGTDEYTLVDDAAGGGAAATTTSQQQEARKVRIQMRAAHAETPEQGSLMWHLTRDVRIDNTSRGFYLVDPQTFTWGSAFDTIVTDGLLLTGWIKEDVELLSFQSISVTPSATVGMRYTNANAKIISSNMAGEPRTEIWLGQADTPIDEAADELICAPGTALFTAQDVDTADVEITATGRVKVGTVEYAVTWIGTAPEASTGVTVQSVAGGIAANVVLKKGTATLGTMQNPAKTTMEVQLDQPKLYTAICTWYPEQQGDFYFKLRVKQNSARADGSVGPEVTYDAATRYPVSVQPYVPPAASLSENELLAVIQNTDTDKADAKFQVENAVGNLLDGVADPLQAAADAWTTLIGYAESVWPTSDTQIGTQGAAGYLEKTTYLSNKLRTAVRMAAAVAAGTSVAAQANVCSTDNAADLQVKINAVLGAQVTEEGANNFTGGGSFGF